MFFEQERLNPTLIDVLRIEQKTTKTVNRDRPYGALSFRFESNAVIETKNARHRLGNDTLAFFPAFADYIRTASNENMIVAHFYLDGNYFQDIECFTPQDPERYGALFEKLYKLWTEKETGYVYRCTAILYEILALAHAERTRQAPQQNHEEKIHSAVDYLMRHFQDPDLTVAQLAERAFVSEVYFRKLFKQAFGMPPKQYLAHLRIEHAKKLIQLGYYSLQEIAALSGFTDYKYFSTEFKRVHGVSPSQYRYKY